MDENPDEAWRPKNDNNTFLGPIRLREALYRSRNLVSIRVLQAIGIDYALDYVSRFGFERDQLPRNLSLALGTPGLTPLEVATGWSVFANEGYKVTPYVVDHVTDRDGKVVYRTAAPRVPQQVQAKAAPASRSRQRPIPPRPIRPIRRRCSRPRSSTRAMPSS